MHHRFVVVLDAQTVYHVIWVLLELAFLSYVIFEKNYLGKRLTGVSVSVYCFARSCIKQGNLVII